MKRGKARSNADRLRLIIGMKIYIGHPVITLGLFMGVVKGPNRTPGHLARRRVFLGHADSAGTPAHVAVGGDFPLHR